MIVAHFMRLEAEHRTAVARHLTSLDRDSRALRFGTAMCDEAVNRYAGTIDFEHDVVEGVWDNLRLVGVAHLAIYVEGGLAVGELGISVSRDARNRHLGKRLLARVLLHARLLRLTRIHVRFLTHNRPMAKLARAFTNIVEMDQGEARAMIDMEMAACAAA